MDWRHLQFDWNSAKAVLVTAEEGSLSAAARALRVSQPTLSRQVSALEKEIGVALFERGTRGLELTPTGQALVEHVRDMGEAAGRFSLSATGRSAAVEGNVCITATDTVAAYGLPDIIAELRRAQPLVEIELIASNSTSDLKRREADIAVRSYRPTQPDLIARKIADLHAYLYATDDYLERMGKPRSPGDLSQADFIGFDESSLLIDAYATLGLKLTAKNFPIITASHVVHWELVKSGAGIGVMPDVLGDRTEGVVRVLPDAKPLDSELWLVAHRELKSSRRMRLVFDYLAGALTESLGRSEAQPPGV